MRLRVTRADLEMADHVPQWAIVAAACDRLHNWEACSIVGISEKRGRP